MSARILIASLALTVTLVAAGCSTDGSSGESTSGQTSTVVKTTERSTTGQSTVAAASTMKITLRGAHKNTGPWVRSLSLEHGEDGQPVSFYVCAAWDEARPRPGCRAASGATLPAGTVLRLEQRPIGPAVTNPDSPGWGTVGTSDRAELEIPLSDFVSGATVGAVTYRVTLRSIDGGPALATSIPFTVTWSG